MALQKSIENLLKEINQYNQTTQREEKETFRQTLFQAFHEVQLFVESPQDICQLPNEMYEGILNLDDQFYQTLGAELIGGFLNFYLVSEGNDSQTSNVIEKIKNTCNPREVMVQLNLYSFQMFSDRPQLQEDKKETEDEIQINNLHEMIASNENKCDILRVKVISIYNSCFQRLKPNQIGTCLVHEFKGVLACLKFKSNEKHFKIWHCQELKDIINTLVALLEQSDNQAIDRIKLILQLMEILNIINKEINDNKAKEL